jgi:predicted O-linked N-acetylglucosamine transferase (SPINDLY family)
LQDALTPLLKKAYRDFQAGRIADAEAAVRPLVTASAPPAALHLMGLIAYRQGKHDVALDFLRRALNQDPSATHTLNLLGTIHQERNEWGIAREYFARTLAVEPDDFDAHEALAVVLQRLGQPSDAFAHFRAILALQPAHAEAHQKFGDLLQNEGHTDEALGHYREALRLRPDLADAHFSLAKALEAVGNRADALSEYRETVLLRPDMVEAAFRLGSMLWTHGCTVDALGSFQAALKHRPDFVEARWAFAMSQLSPVYETRDAQEHGRAAFSEELTHLDEWFCRSGDANGHKAVGSASPFLLAYCDVDNRRLLSRYGDLCERLMSKWQAAQRFPPAGCDDRTKIRLGIVSAHFRDHSVWSALIKGWCRYLDPERISLYLYFTGTAQDQETNFAKARAAAFVHGIRDLHDWVAEIRVHRPHALLFPEVGMDSMTIKLASLRLAPVQVAAWGHPETTGLPTVDHYLSAVDLEPVGAASAYREKLVALPNLGSCYESPDVDPVDVDPASLGIERGRPIFVCAGTPYKYAPQDDGIFVELARRIPRCRFILFDHVHESVSEMLKRRIESRFAGAGLTFADYVTMIPRLRRERFYGLMKRCDVMLDTIGFSGFNTAMQAVECALPVVAFEGQFMRGRLAAGILKRIGLGELVARTADEYVAIAARLAVDASYRDSIRGRMAASRHVLFDDVAPVRALEAFLAKVTADR